MDKTSSFSIHEGKPIRCKAALCRKAGEALVIEEIQVDPPQAYEVRIKILCTSLCHTDVTFWKLDSGPFARFPRILGHEAVGLVESIGEHVEGFKQGDVVLPVFHPYCEECKDCKSSKSNWCGRFGNDFISNTRRYGMSSRFKDSTGEVIHHLLFVSSFSEYTVVDIAHLVKISPDIPVDKAALLSCGVSTGVGATWKVAAVEEGSTVAVFGLGAVGLAVAEGARMRGAAKIIGVDLNPDKFELGKKFGFTDFVNPSLCGEKKVSEVIKEMTGGGVDYSFECVGLASLLSEAFISTRTGSGKTVMLGMGNHAAPVTLGSLDLLSGRTICGSFFGGLKSKQDIPVLVDHYLKKELHLDSFITHELKFQEINKAFELLEEGKSLRCILWMDK
ncbi:Alcohol dehydrogenase-like 2 [Hirschfeldia incana]|nr:Alcohol dehydrogenase-like 2 [Hirschfeldia incana]